MVRLQNVYQIVAMSATLGGLSQLKKWLANAEVYECKTRPVKLTEFILEPFTGQLTQELPQ